MERRKQVLIVTNAMTDEELIQIKKAFQAQTTIKNPIKLSLVHVVPFLPSYFSIPAMGSIVERYYDEAKQSLAQVGQHLSVSKRDQWLISGKIRTEVLKLANKLGSSFILASAKQIQELQRSLFFKNIHQYARIKNINQITNL